jgi:hypothetical protein
MRFGEEPHDVTHGFLTEAFSVVSRYRAELGRQEGLFEDFYRQIEAGGGSFAEIEALADEVHDAEERSRAGGVADLRKVTIGVEYYRRRRDRHARSMVRLGEEMADICASWLELYQNLEIRLRKLASDRDPAPPSKIFSDGAEAVRHLRSLATNG